MRRQIFAVLVVASQLTAGTVRADENSSAREIEFFESRIRPVLVQHCYECHSEASDDPSGGLLLDSREAVRRGGDSGPAIVPGNSQESLLIEAVRHESFEMPPEKMLPDAVIDDFARWIDGGAADPRDAGVGTEFPAAQTADRAKTHWSFQPIVRPPVPEVNRRDWPRGEIDRFLLAGMESRGLVPVEDAERITLIRRAYLDLTGLPPSRQDVEAFVNDESEDAFAKVVNRLLASEPFGVRWGRHWLDVVRYAESTGYERNFTLPHAWRFRDYVIESFNEDKPFDRFVQEQIAGDLLPAESEEQAQEQQIGTGMLALGAKDLLFGNDETFGLEVADDQIDVVCRAMLGLTAACARCHDHKFDPIETEEYYALAGIFLSTEAMYGTNPGSGGGNNRHPSDLLPVGNDAARKHAANRKHRDKVDELVAQLGKANNRLKKLNSQKEPPGEQELAEAKEERNRLQAALDELEAKAPERPGYAMAVREADKMVETAVRLRGVANKKGKTVPRGLIAAVDSDEAFPIGPNESGRKQLADWITAGENPLTSRVIANRIWHHLFGRGIVSTVDNFGETGARPTHPELLDYLATRIQEEGWSIKSLIREIMLSRAYQLGNRLDLQNAELDGENVYYWRMPPRRLEAEVIRDSILAASGTLRLSVPPNGSVVADMGDGCLVRQLDVDPLEEEIPYRTAYLPAARHFQPAILQVFDGPAASLVVGRRNTTNVPAQSLFLLNNPSVVEQSRMMARRLVDAVPDGTIAERVAQAYWWALSRPPSPGETQQAVAFLRSADVPAEGGDASDEEMAAWGAFCQAIFVSAEFRTVF